MQNMFYKVAVFCYTINYIHYKQLIYTELQPQASRLSPPHHLYLLGPDTHNYPYPTFGVASKA
jgi:hypothetical protein